MGRIRLDVPRVDQDVGICDAESYLRGLQVEVLHQMESTVLESTGYLFGGGRGVVLSRPFMARPRSRGTGRCSAANVASWTEPSAH
jgi:hypothetical protein